MTNSRTALFLILSLLSGSSFAVQPGRLDTSFGVGGKQIVPVDIDNFDTSNATTSAIGPNGLVYLVGSEVNGASLAIARLTANGAIDNSFGQQGVVRYLPAGVNAILARDATFDAQGRLLVAGEGSLANGVYMIACRFDAQAAADLSFGTPATPGCFTLPLASSTAQAVLVQNGTNRVILAGNIPSNGKARGAVVGLQETGAIDATFGAGFGLQVIPNGFGQNRFTAVAQNAAGELVAAGSIGFAPPSVDTDFLAFRTDQNGKTVDTFGSGGVWGAAFDVFGAGIDVATAVALSDSGEVTLAGYAQTGPISFLPAVARLDAVGNGDPGFAYEDAVSFNDGNGSIVYKFCGVCDMRPQDMTVMPNGQIVIIGSIGEGVEGDSAATLVDRHDFFAMRVQPDGRRDFTFQSTGSAFPGLSVTAISTLPDAPQDSAFSLAVQGDNLLVSGFTHVDSVENDTPDYNFSVIRLGNGTPLFVDGFED